MEYLSCFKRYELKYLLDPGQYAAVREVMARHTVPDEYGKSTVCNIYYDTPNYRLIRRSIEAPVYKEKLRIRSYGTALPDGRVFVEIKKKYDSVVYKRREAMRLCDALEFVRAPEPHSQIGSEIAYFVGYYRELYPAALISCSREAFFSAADRDLRITFDTDIRWRMEDVDLTLGVGGEPILSDDRILMEIKVAGAIPLWLVEVLSRERIYKISFSKYGRAYTAMLARSRTGRFNNV